LASVRSRSEEGVKKVWGKDGQNGYLLFGALVALDVTPGKVKSYPLLLSFGNLVVLLSAGVHNFNVQSLRRLYG